jgi:hypothetical protein
MPRSARIPHPNWRLFWQMPGPSGACIPDKRRARSIGPMTWASRGSRPRRRV